MNRSKRGAAVPAFGEREAIRLLAARLGQKNSAIRLGIGDDAAWLDAGKEPLVWTIDACLEGSHFERGLLSLEDVGWKSLHAAASDLAAMGARPVAALAALELPREFARAELDALAKGQARAARSLGCPVVGGNVVKGKQLGVTTTVLGVAKAPLRRDRALPGDELWLVGALGLAALGLELLRSKASPRRRNLAAAVRRCVEAWRRPRALVAEGRVLARRARAAIDVSDGLSGDVRRLAEASGVRAVVEERALLAALPPELALAAPLVGRSALELALEGGEDYALVSAGPAKKRPHFAKLIGRLSAGRGAVLELQGGGYEKLGRGFDHLG